MSALSDRKRPANEPLQVLLTQSEGSSDRVQARPVAITLGALFVFTRGLAGLLWLGILALLWPEISLELDVAPAMRMPVLWLILVVGVLASVVSLAIAWFVWRGSNLARVLVMFGVTLSTITAAIGYFTNGDTITVDTTLLNVALDILVLLALSSRDARAWARGTRAKRAT